MIDRPATCTRAASAGNPAGQSARKLGIACRAARTAELSGQTRSPRVAGPHDADAAATARARSTIAGVVDRLAQQAATRPSRRGGSRRPTTRRSRRTRAGAVSAAVHSPTPGSDISAVEPAPARRVTSRSSESARCAQPTIVRGPAGVDVGTMKLHDGMRRHTSPRAAAPALCAGAGPGAGEPHLVTSARQARRASMPYTRCSSTAGMSDSSTRSVRPSRRCGTRRCAAAIVGSVGAESRRVVVGAQAARAVSRLNSVAPLPHASQSTVIGRRLRDPRRHRSAAHQAGAPDRTVLGDVVARVAAGRGVTAHTGQARADRPMRMAGHLTRDDTPARSATAQATRRRYPPCAG